MLPIKNTLNKSERLKSKKLISQVFNTGLSLVSYPIKLLYLQTTNTFLKYPATGTAMVSSKKFKHAVTRNKLKRRLKEAYRTKKNNLYVCLQQENIQVMIIFMYIGKKVESFALIDKKMNLLINQLIFFYKKTNQSIEDEHI